MKNTTIYDYLRAPVKEGLQFSKAIDVFKRKIRSGYRPVFAGTTTTNDQGEDEIVGKMKGIDDPKVIREIKIKIIPTDLSNKYLSEVELENKVVSKEHLMVMFLWIMNPKAINKKVTK